MSHLVLHIKSQETSGTNCISCVVLIKAYIHRCTAGIVDRNTRATHSNMFTLNLLALLSVLFTTTCTIYNVTPDDTKCQHCHNLQRYLLNTTKYFTSNTQLLFLPGLHQLHTNLIIQNVHNISLIGSITTNGTTSDTVILCKSSVGIVMNNITSLVIKDMMIRNCTAGYDFLTKSNIALLIIQCTFVQLCCIQIGHSEISSIRGINTFGNFNLTNISCDSISLHYNETSNNTHSHTVTIDNFCGTNNSKVYSIVLNKLEECFNNLTLQVKNTHVMTGNKENLFKTFLFLYMDTTTKNYIKIFITDCYFYGKILNKKKAGTLFYIAVTLYTSVYFNNCHFHSLFTCISSGIIDILNGLRLHINRCSFYRAGIPDVFGLIGLIRSINCALIKVTNSNFSFNSMRLLEIYQQHDHKKTQVIIQNATFSSNKITYDSLIFITNSNVILSGSVIFHKNIHDNQIIIDYKSIFQLHNTTISANGYIEFSNNYMVSLIYHICRTRLHCFYFNILDSTVINITSNSLSTYFTAEFTQPSSQQVNYPLCYFQYFNVGNYRCYHNVENTFNIILHNNAYKSYLENSLFSVERAFTSDYQLHTTHCYWLPRSAFNGIIPVDVNKQIIKSTNNSNQLPTLNQNKSLCYCSTDCFKEDLGFLYPGQNLTLSLYLFNKFTFKIEVIAQIDTNQTHFTPCVVHNAKQNKQLIGNNCTKLSYTIAFPTDNWCELFLKLPQVPPLEYDIFYIRQLSCPLGFVKIDGICQCYPLFKLFGITDCDINTQNILHPANTWISAATNNSYYISQHCPFHYCLPYSFPLNLSTPDLQCQFNRSGLLCGQCQHGLSTVFGSSYCKKCSNVYLTLIIPIAIAGLLLVLLLFLLNLTVTNGSINAFILYVNIISINSTVFFPHQNTVSPAYIFISLANLDLGIQTCFYNGMDDYAKMWLQLTFPFYLIFLATLIIITSRYSTKIQRLTANRALPVLATLFLLSYTKILRTVSSVLFFYSSITHLPSQHTTQVWSVDANIPLFGVKFTIIFLVCLVLFVILIPFNIILLFTRTLSRFNAINKFKPLLDAYQGPYKIKFYYWTGLQLVIRVVFFSISSLDIKTNITAGIIILSIIEGVDVICKPFKNKFNNYQELCLIINLLVLYTLTLSSQDDVNMTGVNIMITIAAAHFSLIIIYHLITYVRGGNRLSIEAYTHKITEWVSKLNNRTRRKCANIQLQNEVPEANRYNLYQESLLAPDYDN